MTSIKTADSQGSGFEISATLVSLRKCFEAVRPGEIQRVGRRFGDLSPDFRADLALNCQPSPKAQAFDRDDTGARNPFQLGGTWNCFRYSNKTSSGGLL